MSTLIGIGIGIGFTKTTGGGSPVVDPETWAGYETGGVIPKTWAEMETGGSYEKTWSDLETVVFRTTTSGDNRITTAGNIRILI